MVVAPVITVVAVACVLADCWLLQTSALQVDVFNLQKSETKLCVRHVVSEQGIQHAHLTVFLTERSKLTTPRVVV